MKTENRQNFELNKISNEREDPEANPFSNLKKVVIQEQN